MSSRRFAPRLTRGEYWILNSLVEHPYPLYFFSGPDRFLQDVFNRQPHGLTEDEVTLTLLGLFNAGWIEGETHPRCTSGPQPPDVPFDPTGAGIRAAFEPQFYRREGDGPRRRRRDPEVTIRLTPEGGGVWEAFAKPRWEHFFQDFYEHPDGGRSVKLLRAVDRTRGQQYAAYWGELEEFDPAAIVWKPVAPFPATYWKTLPVGFEARVRCTPGCRARQDLSSSEIRSRWQREHAAYRDSERFRRWWAWE